jgi:uncharacterized phiE125 gp8 family phage protein
MASILLNEAESELISMEEIKMHLRIDGVEEDAYLSHLLTTARYFVEQYTGLSLVQRTWLYHLDRFPEETIFLYLPHPPIQSITYLKYIDTDGEVKTMTEGKDFIVDVVSQPARIAPLLCWPQTGSQLNAVTIEYISGWASVPAPIKHAMLLIMGHWYENREAVFTGALDEVPAVSPLLVPYRIWRFA